MTRDELVQAAIEALDAADVDGRIEWYQDLEGEFLPGIPPSAVQIVVDTVLTKLGPERIRVRHADHPTEA